MVGAQPRGHHGGPLHRGAADGRTGAGRRHPRQVQTHHDCGSGGSASGRSCPTPVRPTGTESAVGRRPDLCLYLVGFRLRGVRGRCLCTPDPGLASGINNGDLDGARRDRAVYLDASTRRRSRFERCCPPHGSRIPVHVDPVQRAPRASRDPTLGRCGRQLV